MAGLLPLANIRAACNLKLQAAISGADEGGCNALILSPVQPFPRFQLHLMATKTLLKTLLLLVCAGLAQAQTSPDPVLYAQNEASLFDGKYGKVAQLQAALKTALAQCRAPDANVIADGRFSPATAQAIRAVSLCPALRSKLPEGSAAFDGAITVSLWRALLPRVPLPDVAQRAQTLVLTYEATDYDDLEWNFCQSRPRWTPDDPTKPCYTNDPRSYITWGPRGATAGHGREVQWILWRVQRRDRRALTRAFGTEAAAVRQLLTLNDDSARRLLCSVFADTLRRDAWTAGFANLGKVPLAREMYDLHYLSPASDGAKMAQLYRVWELLGLSPTAVDYGFFLDRATHSTPPAPEIAATRIREWLAAKSLPVAPAFARQAFAATFPTPNQAQDRLGRDVAFFLDNLGADQLSEAERTAWQRRGRLRASDAGLFDFQPAPLLTATAAASGPAATNELNPAPACPPSVLQPQRPPR